MNTGSNGKLKDSIYFQENSNPIKVCESNNQIYFNYSDVCKIFNKNIDEFKEWDKTLQAQKALKKYNIDSDFLEDTNQETWGNKFLMIILGQWIEDILFETWLFLTITTYDSFETTNKSNHTADYNYKETQRKRSEVIEYVTSYASATGQKLVEVWVMLYHEFKNKFEIDPKNLTKDKELIIDKICKTGYIDDLLEIAWDLIGR